VKSWENMDFIMDWHDPTPQEIKAIHNVYDVPIIAVIDGLSEEDRKFLYNSIVVREEYKEDFKNIQILWMGDFKGYWKENHQNKDPTECPEFGDDFVKSCEYERSRLYYAAKYPDRVDLKNKSKRTLEFFLEIDSAIKIGNAIISYLKIK
jgi:hypothetical protein